MDSESNALSKRSASKGSRITASASADSDITYVYILRCSDRTFYVGHASDPDERVAIHNAGDGARWTACRRPVELVYHEAYPSKVRAIARERQIKRWSHAKKLALISGSFQVLKSLAKRHGG